MSDKQTDEVSSVPETPRIDIASLGEVMCEIIETREEHETLEKYLNRDEFDWRKAIKEKIALKRAELM